MSVIRHCMVAFALCTADGEPLGATREASMVRALGWSDARPLVALAAAEWGLQVTILRLIDAHKRDDVWHLRYAAEVDSPARAALQPVRPDDFDEQQLRQPWARPGGAQRTLAWAGAALTRRGMRPVAQPEQVRTWNLSSLWRIPHEDGAAWLKEVPSFFAHEGTVIERLQRFAVPRVLARDGAACLLDEVPGEDLYGAPAGTAVSMIDALVEIQSATTMDASFTALLPDWRLPAIAEPATRALEQSAEQLSAAERSALASLIEGLAERARQLDECGLPDTLVHGDFHPGNARGMPREITLLDWGDSGLGHPLLDVAAFTERMTAVDASLVVAHWLERWRAAVPGSDPARALELIGPVSALRQAAIYQSFLDQIEPDERIYHAGDPALWLQRTAALLGVQ